MGGCFSAQQPAEPTTRTESPVSGKCGRKDAVDNQISIVDGLPELASGYSCLKLGIDNGVASDSIECRSTGLPSIRYKQCQPQVTMSHRNVESSGSLTRQTRRWLNSAVQPTYLSFLLGCSTSDYSNLSAATPTSVLPPVHLSSRNNQIWAHSHYMKVRNLRDGSSGSVHLAVDLRFGNQVAIKFIPRGSNRCGACITSANIV